MLSTVLTRASCIISLAILLAFSAQSQDRWSWPEKPSNLQVLPKDWPGSKLQPVMIGFTRALGVRCSFCHKGEEGKPLNTYDFASDQNPNKDRAREMLRMLADINADLKKIQPTGEKRVNMWCGTCHRGLPRPLTLEEELEETYQTKGLQPAIDDYADLKKKYYGRGSYDFGERSLNAFGYDVLEKDATGAIQVFKLNAEEFPQSGNVWDSLAEAYAKAGDLKKAEENYEKSLKLDPTNQHAKDELAKIREIKKTAKAQ